MPDNNEGFTTQETVTLLRRQRHEFLNHLQTVYSCLELEKVQAAMEYISNLQITAPADAAALRAMLAEKPK